MTVETIVERITDYMDLVEKQQFVVYARKAAEIGDQLVEPVAQVLGNTDAISAARALAERSAELLRSQNLMTLFHAVISFQQATSRLYGHLGRPEPGHVHQHAGLVGELCNETLQKRYDRDPATRLAFAAVRFRDSLDGQLEVLKLISQALSASPSLGPEEVVGEIYLDAELNATEIAELLLLLQRLYVAAHDALKAPQAPVLRVIRVEVGSSWAKVIGDYLAIPGMLTMLGNGLSEAWRKFGPGGSETLAIELAIKRADAIDKTAEIFDKRGLLSEEVNQKLTEALLQNLGTISALAAKANKGRFSAEAFEPLVVQRGTQPQMLPSPASLKSLPPG